MHTISITELKTNPMKVLKLSYSQDVQITNQGKVVGLLTSPFKTQIEELKSIFGILPKGTTVEDGKDERCKKILESL